METEISQTYLVIFHSIWDNFDVCRSLSYDILSSFPVGENAEELFIRAISSALQLVNSPRARECDSGSLFFVLASKKFLEKFSWSFIVDGGNVVKKQHDNKDEGENFHQKITEISSTFRVLQRAGEYLGEECGSCRERHAQGVSREPHAWSHHHTEISLRFSTFQ